MGPLSLKIKNESNCSGSHKGTKTQRLNISLSPYLKSLPAIASRSGEAGGEEDNVPPHKKGIKRIIF